MTITIKKIRENILKGFRTLSAREGKKRPKVNPAAKGTPRIRKMVVNTSMGLRLTALNIAAVSGFRLPQRERLRGVIKMAAAVETAVMLMDTAQFPFARYVMILERLPPGQDATRIMPKAMDGCGRNTNVSKNVKAGRK